MSLSIDGVWKAGVWAETVWTDGVWYEGDPVIPPVIESDTFGGVKRRHPRVLYEPPVDEEEQEQPLTVKEIKRIVIRKVGNAKVAKKVEAKVVEKMHYQPILQASEAIKMIEAIKLQESLLKRRKSLHDDDEEVIKLFL